MNMRQQQPKQWLCSHLPQLLLGLILLQPALDVLSFWQYQAGVGNGLTLLLRFAMLLTVALAGFYLSERKRVYVALAAVLVYRLAQLESFGVPYLTPFAASGDERAQGHGVIRWPTHWVKFRERALGTQNQRRQG